ncbi:MAG TPA: cytidine deaminase [Flavitalea sp.]|nr:cytidine deaminase [Flavitalea sp.]
MSHQHIRIDFETFASSSELNAEDQIVLDKARSATGNAYAPYSNFQVGAAARLLNGEVVTGSNQENAAFPAGLCAERVMLSAISSLYPEIAIAVIAVSYQQPGSQSVEPIAPCGVCRQTLQEYEFRGKQPIRLILSGMEGKVVVFSSVSELLPFAFTKQAMKQL